MGGKKRDKKGFLLLHTMSRFLCHLFMGIFRSCSEERVDFFYGNRINMFGFVYSFPLAQCIPYPFHHCSVDTINQSFHCHCAVITVTRHAMTSVFLFLISGSPNPIRRCQTNPIAKCNTQHEVTNKIDC